MALQDMQAELRGSFPKIPFAFTKTLINRAYKSARLAHLWSFNILEFSWITPPPIFGVGTVTTVQGLSTVTFDATARAAIAAWQTANPYVLFTQMQFRVSIGGIYSIIAYVPGTGVATLDRLFGDASTVASVFQVYQNYYVPPVIDFLTPISVRNPQTFLSLGLYKSREWLDKTDPQRTSYMFPTQVIPYGTDQRGAGTVNASSTLGYPMYEFWGQAITPYTYQVYGLRRGVDLANPTDTLPLALADETVLAKARVYAYEWAEANKDIAPRNSGPDFKFLMGSAQAEYKELLIRDRRNDRELMDNYCLNVGTSFGNLSGIYNTLAHTASTYAPIY